MQATPIAEMDAVLLCMPAAARVVMTPHRAAVALCSCVLSAGLVCTLQCTVQYTGRPPTVLLSATIQYTFTHIDRQVGERDMIFVKLRQGSGKDRQGMAVKVKGLKA